MKAAAEHSAYTKELRRWRTHRMLFIFWGVKMKMSVSEWNIWRFSLIRGVLCSWFSFWVMIRFLFHSFSCVLLFALRCYVKNTIISIPILFSSSSSSSLYGGSMWYVITKQESSSSKGGLTAESDWETLFRGIIRRFAWWYILINIADEERKRNVENFI